jgi:hypothetical protein
MTLTPGTCIIKLIMGVIYGFHNKLECLTLNPRLGWKGLSGTNTLAYYKHLYITTVKSFMTLTPGWLQV